jgi:transposase-like protein
MILMTTNEDSQIGGRKRKCPKCGNFNTLSIGAGKDQSFSCLDCDYKEGTGIE